MTTTEPIRKKRRLWPWITLLVIALLVAGIRLALRADFVLEIIRAQAEEAVTEAMDGDIRIGNLTGDLLRGITVRDVRLRDAHGEQVVAFDSLVVAYDPWSWFRPPVLVSEISLYGPDLNVRQLEDDRWNILELFPSDPDAPVEESTFALPLILLESIALYRGQIAVEAPGLLPDERVRAENLEVRTRVLFSSDTLDVQLSKLEFALREGRLDERITFGASATYGSDMVTLDRLFVATGRSVLEASASFRESDEAIGLDARLEPLSWRDVAAYAESVLFAEDLSITLGVSGSLSDLALRLGVTATGLEELTVRVRGDLTGEMEVREIEADIRKADFRRLAGDASMPVLDNLSFLASGSVPVNDPEASRVSASLRVDGLLLEPYALDRADLAMELTSGRADGSLSLRYAGERLETTFRAGNVFSDTPDWNVRVRAERMQPGVWAQLSDLPLILDVDVRLSGRGFEPGASPWRYQIGVRDLLYDDQAVERIQASGSVTNAEIDLVSEITLKESVLALNAAVSEWQQEDPSYSFFLETQRLDLRDLAGLEEFPTRINLKALGEGRGIDPETMSVYASLEMDSSLVNGAEIERFQANFFLKDAVLEFRDTFLESTFASGKLDIRQHMSDLRSPDNRVAFDLQIGDLNPLAPLAGLDYLDASGSASGTFTSNENGIPVLDALLSLQSVSVDTLYFGEISGRAQVLLPDDPEFSVDFRISEIITGGFDLDDIWLVSEGVIGDESATGNYRLEVGFTENTSLRKQATFSALFPSGGAGNPGTNLPPYNSEANTPSETSAGELPSAPGISLRIETDVLSIEDPDYAYFLRQPFALTFEQELLKLEPIVMVGDSDVEFRFEFEQYGAEAFRGAFTARDVNLGILQRIVLDDVIADGMMTGGIRFDADLSRHFLDAEGDLRIEQLEYNGYVIDSFVLDARIRDEQLTAELDAQRQGATLLTGRVQLPFFPGPAEARPSELAAEEVFAGIQAGPVDLSDNPELLSALGLEDFAGLLRADIRMTGTAGNPSIAGGLSLERGRLSGVAVDSVSLGWEYMDADRRLQLRAIIESAGQTAAFIGGSIPFYIDLEELDAGIPEESNGLDIRVESNGFNLASLNEFADATLVRNIAGSLNADLQIRGEIEQPEVTGFVHLVRGQVFAVENNVTFRDINSRVTFASDRIRIENFSVQSAGSLTGSGTVMLDRFSPQTADIELRSRNFRVFNTRDVQAFMSMDTRLAGDVNAPKLTGRVTLDRGYLYLDNFGERTVEDVVLDDEEVVEDTGIPFWNNLEMELIFGTQRNFWVRNRSRPEVQLQLQGELDLVKYRNEDVQVFGSMGASEGFVNQLGRRFNLEEAEVTFSGPPENPALNVRTLYEVRQVGDVRIWYIIGGTVEEPQFSYESEPEMELQDIISYTLFGRPFHSLMAWEQTVSGRSDAAVADAAVDILLDRVEQLATQALGIDLLQIDNTRTGGQSGTTIKAGKYISDRLFVALLQELGANVSSQVIMEYQIRRNLDLVITGSDNYQTGIDIMWRRDY